MVKPPPPLHMEVPEGDRTDPSEGVLVVETATNQPMPKRVKVPARKKMPEPPSEQ